VCNLTQDPHKIIDYLLYLNKKIPSAYYDNAQNGHRIQYLGKFEFILENNPEGAFDKKKKLKTL
jgi:hypothetical protein